MDIYPNDIRIFFGYLDIKRLNLYPKNIRIFFGYISDISRKNMTRGGGVCGFRNSETFFSKQDFHEPPEGFWKL